MHGLEITNPTPSTAAQSTSQSTTSQPRSGSGSVRFQPAESTDARHASDASRRQQQPRNTRTLEAVPNPLVRMPAAIDDEDPSPAPRDPPMPLPATLQQNHAPTSVSTGPQQKRLSLDDGAYHEGATTSSSRSKKGAMASLSLQAIIVVACGVFAFVTSFVSFYVQYDFFLTEYGSQMKSRVGFYGDMFGNQVNIKSNSNASSLAHVASSARFDAYDGSLNPNPTLAQITDFQWYLQQTNTMFAGGSVIRYTFPLTGNTLTVTVNSPYVDLCADMSGFGTFFQMTWVINATLNLWFPITPMIPCTDGRLTDDMVKILANGALYAEPMLGTSTPFASLNYNAAALDNNDAILFAITVILKPAAIVEWGSTAPNVEAFFIDDNGKLVGTTRSDLVVNVNTTIYDLPIPYLQSILPSLAGFLTPVTTDLRGQHFNRNFEGFAWGYHELPLLTLSGRTWRILIIDVTHTELTGNTPLVHGGLLIAGGTIAAIVICAIVFHIWFSPLSDLAARVRSSGGIGGGYHMQVDGNGGDPHTQQLHAQQNVLNKPMSFTMFSEIARAQEAYINVQESLQEIQSYIPQSLQQHTAPAVHHHVMEDGDRSAMVGGDAAGKAQSAAATAESPGVRNHGEAPTPSPAAAGQEADVFPFELVERRPATEDGDRDSTPNLNSLAAAGIDVTGANGHSQDNLNATGGGGSSSGGAGGGGGGTGAGSSTRRPSTAPSAATTVDDRQVHDHHADGVDSNGNMLPCRMTTLHLRMHRFAKWELVVPFLEMAATRICQYDGVLDTVDYGSITATFNCHKACPTHEYNAVAAASDIRRAAYSDKKYQEIMSVSPFSIGIDTDIAVALTVGFEDVKARVVIGPGFELARKLATLAYDIVHADVLITGHVAHAIPTVPSLVVDYIQPRRETIQMLSGSVAAAAASSREGFIASSAPLGDGKTVHELVALHPTSPLDGTDDVTQNLVEMYRSAFLDMREGRYASAAGKFDDVVNAQPLKTADGEMPSERNHNVEHTLRKQASRLWSICSSRKESAADGTDKYVRPERCPWDVLPIERELCQDRDDAPLVVHHTAVAASPQQDGASRGSGITGYSSAAPDPALNPNMSYVTDWSQHSS